MSRPRFTTAATRRRQRSSSNEGDEPTESAVARPDAHRRPKRRRLDHDVLPVPKSPIKYGHYGQVEPGKLQLQLISCDGGEHRDSRAPAMSLGPDNILCTDKSVYCSERESATIILRHADDTPFTLEKLHIVGPEHGFTAPVREGLVHVAMSFEDLQPHIDPPIWARRSGVNNPPYRPERTRQTPQDTAEHSGSLERRRQIRETMAEQEAMIDDDLTESEGLTLSDALRDPVVSAALNHSSRRSSPDVQETAIDLHRAAEFAEGRPERRRRVERDYYGDDFGFGRRSPSQHCDIIPNHSATSSSSFGPFTRDQPTQNHLNHPSITITSSGRSIIFNPRDRTTRPEPYTAYSRDSDSEDEDTSVEENSSQEVLDYRLQRLRQMRRHYNTDVYNDPTSRWSLGGLTFDAQGNPVRPGDDEGPVWTQTQQGPWRRQTYGHGRPTQARMDRLDNLMARSRIRSEETANDYDSPPAEPRSPPEPEPIPNRYWEEDFGNAPASRAAHVGLHPFHPDNSNTTHNNQSKTDPSPTHGRENTGDDKVTCTRFRIERGKHRVAIGFEPAISGRFIMLKLWAGKGNVDVQGVVARGFGGPRFFESKGFV
ncbi:hypothetical protein MBLNU230_g2223t1 [Neophaeotheca triangularis]